MYSVKWNTCDAWLKKYEMCMIRERRDACANKLEDLPATWTRFF